MNTANSGPSQAAATALVVLLALTSAMPARAQFFGDRFPSGPRQGQPPEQRGFFSFPFFGEPPRPPAEPTRPPPPKKVETPPTSTIAVIGDSFADWLAYGLEETFADTPEVGVLRKIRPSSGLVRYDPRNETLDWSQAIKDILANDKPSAIVVMLGLNDRLPMRDRVQRPGQPKSGDDAQQQGAGTTVSPSGQSATPQGGATSSQEAAPPTAAASEPQQRPGPGGMYEFHTDKWAEIYSKRIDDMIAALKARGVPVVWVGLPAIRGPKSTSDMSYLDELYRARAEKAGIVYVDIWDGFVDEQGRYATQGPDFEGQIRRLRTGDGVHFTKAGAVKLASYVAHELRRVMSTHLAPIALPAPEENATGRGGASGSRPAIGPVLPLTSTISGEGNDLLGAPSKPPPVTTDPLAARVLTHGEAIAAPSGRADDFSWPRPGANAAGAVDDAAEPAVLAPVAPAKGGPTVKKDATKPADAKADAGKSKPSQPDAPVMRRAPNATLDGAPPRPPAPVGAAAGTTTAR